MLADQLAEARSNYPDVHVHIVSKSHFHYLRGHCGLQMTSEVKFYLGFEIRGLTNL